MRKLVGLGALLALTGAVMVAAPSAGAYGNTAVYQITFSLNCTSPSPGACDQFGGPGGVWGWIELDADGTPNSPSHRLSWGPGLKSRLHRVTTATIRSLDWRQRSPSFESRTGRGPLSLPRGEGPRARPLSKTSHAAATPSRLAHRQVQWSVPGSNRVTSARPRWWPKTSNDSGVDPT